MNGKDQYSGLDLRTRKMMLGSFRVFFRHMPVRYYTFAYATKQFASLDKLAGAMRRDIVNFLFDNLAELQSYDMVKVYYDNGQQSTADLDAWAEMLQLSATERGYIGDAVKPGEGLLISAGIRVPITDDFPKGPLYDLWNTKPAEVAEREMRRAAREAKE